MTSIQEICRKHPDQWVAVRVTEEKDHEPVAGELLAVATTHGGIYDKIKLSRDYVTAVFFTTDPIDRGHAVLY